MFTESLVPTTSLRGHSSVSISNSILHLKQYHSDMTACLTKPEGKKMNLSYLSTVTLCSSEKVAECREVYVNDPGDRRGARLKFRFRTRSASLRAEVGGWKNKEEARQCVMCSEGEEESVEHVLMRCTAYRSEREQLWELMEAERGLGEEWRWLEEEEKVKVLLGQDMCMEGGERIDRSVKSYLRKVMDERRRGMGLGTRTQ